MKAPRWLPGLMIAAFCAIHGVSNAQGAEPRDEASPWGIASGAEWSGEYPRFNPMLHDAGVRWLRIFDEWSEIQPRQGEWKWEGMDAKVENARANHIHLTGGLWYFAPWASATGDTRTSPVKDIQFWRDYVSGVVTRYQKDIKYWEVWNEFNGSFAVSKNKPKEYADLVRAAYDSAKKIDPGAKIGMSCANFDVGFFDAAIKAGAADHFDFLCIHPYENLGMAMDGGESGFLSMAGSLRKMLSDNHQNPNMPLWITEIGYPAPVRPDAEADARQATALTKAYVLSLAQGFSKIFWFEARGPEYGQGTDHGLIRADWTPRPSYTALKVMSGLLGAEPVYGGWLNFDGGYGFVFKGAQGDVLAAWAPPASKLTAVFPADVRIIDLSGKETALAAHQPLALSTTPQFIVNLPATLARQARDNAAKPFPWNSGYADAETVSCRLGATNTDHGIKQTNQKTTQVVNLLDSSCRSSDIGNDSLNGEGFYAYFRVDPQFAGFGTRQLEITVVARRADPERPASFQITYESQKGYKSAPGGRWSIPAGEAWSEHTWKVNDANFVGAWGWNFRTDAGGSPNDFLIKEVRVKRVGPGK